MTSPRQQDERGSSSADLSAQSADRELSSTRNSSALDWSRDLVLHTHDLLCIHNLKGQLLSINPEPARMLGYTVDELLRIPMREMLPPEFRPQFDEYLEKIARVGEADGLLTVTTRAGEKRIWEYHNTLQRPEGAEPVVHGIAHDVTEQKRIEHELRKSEKQIRLFIEHAPAALAMFDRDMCYIDVSRRWRHDYGLGDRDIRGLSHYDNFPREPEQWEGAHRRGLAGEVVRGENDRFERADGSVKWIRWEVRPWHGTRGEIGGIVILSEDITERKQAEEALRASETEFKQAQRVARFGSWTLDIRTDKVFWSEELFAIVGADPAVVALRFSEHAPLYTPETWARLKAAVDNTKRTGAPYEMEVETVRTDGSHGWLEVRGEAVRGTNGEMASLRGVARDITEQKNAERALRKSEAELREAQRLGRIGSWYRDLRTDALTWSEQIDCVLGLAEKAQPLTFKQAERFFTPESWQRVVQTNPKLIADGGSDELEVEFRRQDGTTGWAIMYREAVRDETGKIVGIRGVGLDITERKRAEEELRGSELRYRLLFEKGIAGVCTTSLEGRIIQCNDAWAHMFGFEDAAEGVGSSGTDRWPDPAGRSAFVDEIRRCGSISNRERKFLRKNGDVFWGFVNSVLVDGEDGPSIQSTVFDVTERKRAEDALRESEERFRSLYENSTMGLYRTTPDGRILLANPSLVEMLGFSSFSELGQRNLDQGGFEPGYDRANFKCRLENEGEVRGLESSWTRKDGTAIFVRESVKAIRNEKGEIAYYEGTVEDISEQKRAEEALRASEERMRLAQQAAKIGSFERNMQTGEGIWSAETEEMFGLQPGQGPKSIEEFLNLIHPEDRPHVQNLLDESIATGSTVGEWRVIWPDGSVHWIDGRWKVFKDEQGRPLRAIGIDADITERKFAEETLRASVAREHAHAKELETILDTIPIPVLIARDPQCTEITANRAGYEHLRLEPGTNVSAAASQEHGLRHRFLQDGVEVDADRLPMDRAAATGRAVRGVNTKLVFSDGVEKHELGNAAPLFDDQGQVRGAVGAAIDITERIRAEEALRESEERLRMAQEVANIGAFDRNLLTGENRWTKQAMTIYGLSPDAPAPSLEQVAQLVHPQDRESFSNLLAESMESGEGGGEWRIVWPDGSVRWIAGRWRVLKNPYGEPIRMIGSDYDVTDRKRIEEELRRAKEKLTEEKHYFEHAIDAEMGFEEIIGSSAGLKSVMEQVSKVAPSDATVLLLGETGVGKELVARAIHRLSQRKDNSFIKMNCAAIPGGLLESELFGAEKGAYTGSVSRKIGRMELADKGTIFLDEIGEIALALQPKLLRVLQDQEFERLGGTQTIKVNFRLIAATNRDLTEEVRANQFRSDLFYRLNVFPIRVPPLRERRDDIPLLVEYFVKKIGRRLNRLITSVPRRTLNELCSWDWPGNVRELENFIERSVILSPGTALAAPLGELQAKPTVSAVGAHTLEAAERKIILEALRLANGRISGQRGAAIRLGLKRTTLQSKLKQLGINPRTLPLD